MMDEQDKNEVERTLEQRAAEGDPDALLEMFPTGSLEGDRRTLGNIVRPSHRVELNAIMSNGKAHLRDGLPDPEKLIRYAVTCKFAGFAGSTPAPIWERQPDGNEKIVGWRIDVRLAPTYIEQLGQGESAVTVEFDRLLAADPPSAGRLLEILTSKFSDWSRSGERPRAA
jgi:hypothetical protein